ncbi:hypothetical protein [Emticicia sp. BO119]|uniref:hypothetical protein n=1 Tax=Emticicia sp. BO119 TaxID=2757768 RepID=UPI0015F00603|nr:hypothetical protein [Emticicia sp. BO119]MBA4851216.1 hypothetical protein [Emticicia sp. BO119]
MKKLLLLIFISATAFGQAVEITPSSAYSLSNAIIKKNGVGFEQSDVSGNVRVGTYADAGAAFIQTHSNHSLRFTTNNGGQQMILTTEGKVGIGSDAPAYWLDVKGRARIRQYSGETAGIWYNKSNNSEGAFTGMFNDDIFGLFGMGTVSNWKFGFDMTNTRLGIGTMTPKHPLTFPTAIGDKISLWGGNTASTDNHYGMGVQAAAFQLFVPTTSDNIMFGVGRSAAFTEKMRITGNGNVQSQGSDAGYLFYDRSNVAKGYQWYANNGNAYLFKQHASSGNVMTILDNGNVGIGFNTTPAFKLQVSTTGNSAGMVHINNVGIQVGTYAGSGMGWYGTLSNHPLGLFVNNGGPAFTITTDERFQFGGTPIPAGYKMSVDGKVLCTELEVLVTPWPDYVFKPDYRLKPLHEVEHFIQTNGHLPNIPKAEEIENKSLAVGNMSKLQMEKIEELTLYLIEINKRLKKVEDENEALKRELANVKSKN